MENNTENVIVKLYNKQTKIIINEEYTPKLFLRLYREIADIKRDELKSNYLIKM